MQTHLPRKKKTPLFRSLSFSNTNMEMGLDSREVWIMLHAIWLSCCALGLLAISTSKTENLASATSCCAFLVPCIVNLKPRVWVASSSITISSKRCLQNKLMAVSPLATEPNSFYTENFDSDVDFPGLHKTHSNSGLSSRWFMFQTAHQRLSQTSQLLAGKRSGRFGKETWVCGYGRWRKESDAPGGDGKVWRFGITTEAKGNQNQKRMK